MRSKVVTNLESVGEMIGALKGMNESMDEPLYTEGLIRQAHEKAANAFDLAAAATGATGHLSHAFEYGVPGITPGTARFPDPTDPSARLWVHNLTGKGGAMDVSYAFRPALMPNPQPTTASTGVASKYLQKLSRRKYIFWNRAYVMETGQTVGWQSHQPHGMLFIPFNQMPSKNPNNKKGFVMWNTHAKGFPNDLRRPGATVQGNFTAAWMRFWGGTGGAIMEEDMRKTVLIDTARAEAEISKRAAAAAMKPVQATNIPAASNRGFARVKKLFGAVTSKRATVRTK